jgi:hypothetical protein
VLDVSRLTFPLDASEPNPFVRWRGLFHAYHLGTAHGMSDEAFVELVRDLDSEVARVDGHGFVVTPFTAAPVLADRLDIGASIWVKDETGNVAGSHKARHLFGLLVHLEVVRLLGMTGGTLPPLAIASCGNAALAAAVVAAAGRRRLLVFVPTGCGRSERRSRCARARKVSWAIRPITASRRRSPMVLCRSRARETRTGSP